MATEGLEPVIRERLATIIPDAVMTVCRTLATAGHEAYTVGGAVRDAILKREVGDWDVATSAHPDQVIELFRRTIPTGLQHGTVTVLIGHGESRQAIEVTTFRGEGAYSDARRPDSVTFGVPLREDLARRDFVINAMAYDPVSGDLHDPFGGAGDLADKRIRAVGVAAERFLEDGLRVMRAIRFAAKLEFELDADTERAIPEALPSLAKVSRERIRDELFKLMTAREPSRGLRIAQRTGILAVILPELHIESGLAGTGALRERWSRDMARVDAASELLVRVGSLVVDSDTGDDVQAAAARVDALLRRLKLSNADRESVVRLVRFGRAWRPPDLDDADVRTLLGTIGRAHVPALLALWRADAVAFGAADPRVARITGLVDRVTAILDAGDPLVVGDLAIRGADVMRVLQIGPGRVIGEVLAAVLARVLVDPGLNESAALESLITQIYADIA